MLASSLANTTNENTTERTHMSEPFDQLTETKLQVVALARASSDEHLDLEAASTLLDAIDHRQGLIVAARFLHACCRDLARHMDCTTEQILNSITDAVIEAAANPER
jgi:hypothetical protein